MRVFSIPSMGLCTLQLLVIFVANHNHPVFAGCISGSVVSLAWICGKEGWGK